MNRIDYNKGVSARSIDFYELEKESLPEQSKNNPLLDLIFSPDERGCLNGDLALYLGEKTNPEIRTFIEQQLLQDNTSEQGGLSLGNDVINKMKGTISDDDIAFFSRNHGESPERYALRIGQYFADERAKNMAKAKYNREKQRLESLGFNFD